MASTLNATSIVIKTRAPGQAAGAPSSLKSGELAWNMTDGLFYAGYGDNGSGIATSVKAFAGQDFNPLQRLPAGGTAGYVLVKASGNDYDAVWQQVTAGTTYSGGTGVTVSGSTIAVNTSVVALLANPAFTGNPTAPTQAAGDSSTKLATTAFVAALGATKAEASHTHAAENITSGQFDAARIPALDASKITTGVFDIARIPVLPGNKTVVSGSNIASLTAAQQSDIDVGTIVTTNDGRRWVYSTGSKTSESSYVELADVTPEWAVIANKPNFHAVATSGSYTDLANRPSLGTMASQNASSVAITGGSLANVSLSNVSMTDCVISGGTF